jgi:hypothetical protein
MGTEGWAARLGRVARPLPLSSLLGRPYLDTILNVTGDPGGPPAAALRFEYPNQP